MKGLQWHTYFVSSKFPTNRGIINQGNTIYPNLRFVPDTPMHLVLMTKYGLQCIFSDVQNVQTEEAKIAPSTFYR